MKSRVNHWLSMADPAWKIIPISAIGRFMGAGSRHVKVVSPYGSEFEFGVNDHSSSFTALTPPYFKGENKVASDLVCEFLGLSTNYWWP